MKTMGKSSRHLAASLMVMALILIGCQDEILFHSNRPVEEGIPTRVSLGYVSQESIILTRTEQTSEYENRIENIYLFVFNSAGQRQPLLQNMEGTPRASNLFTFNDGLNPEGDNLSNGKGTLDFVCSSLQGASIVAIANITTNSTGTAYNVTSAQLDEINDLNTLKQFVMTMNSQSVYRGALFMMTGYAEDNESGSTSIDIVGSEQGEELNYTIQLKRTDAKVKFIVKTDPPSEKNWRNFSFLPKEWTVKRVPLQSYILEAETGDYESDDAIYFNTSATAFEEITPNATDANLYDGGSFVFYMPENKKTPLQSVSDYAQRDAWNTGKGLDDNGNRTFTNANANSTYVEMTGTLSYVDNNNMLVNADVRFIIHLGYMTSYKDKDGQTINVPLNPNDYDTKRNSFYTYNVTIRGVNDIIVEVTNENGEDKRPGYEGDVVYSTTDIFEFDSHYDRRLIQLNKKAIGTDMKWSVNTPFSRGIHDATDDDKIEESMRDYRWVKFAINYDYNVDNEHLVKYPGDQNYNDPFPMDESNNNLSSPYFSSGGDGYNAERNTQNARLLDVNQLICRLQKEAANENSSIFFTDETDRETKVAITVFVDEHLYFNHPLTNMPGEEVDEQGNPTYRSLWKLTTDKEDRQLHIIAQGAQMSPDGNSSVVNSTFTFKQRPISTIFNVDKKELKTAWGLESVMETKRLSCGLDKLKIQKDTETRNGRSNTLDIILGPDRDVTLHWTEVLNTDDHYTLNSNYNNALYACLLRNRDLNGDNIIQAKEIRWYLAAIDQLTDIYLGEYALDEKSRLYPSNPADRDNKVRWHYTSSSIDFTAGGWFSDDSYDSWVLWAEEGASRGMQSSSKTYNDELYSYRCVRNLGLSLDDPDEVPTDLISYKDEGSGFYLIDATNLNIKARRTNYEVSPLPLHNEREANNLPYGKFRMHSSLFPTPESSSGRKNYHEWQWYQTFDGYPAGYRIPNQRELLILSSRLPEDVWNDELHMCQTAFSMDGQNPYNENRDGFIWKPSTKEFFLQNNPNTEKGYVRPVQDVQE